MPRTVAGTFTEDGESDPVLVNSSAVVYVGSTTGQDFGGAPAQIQIQAPSGVWYPTGDPIETPNSYVVLVHFPGAIRVALADSTTPDLDYEIQSDRPE